MFSCVDEKPEIQPKWQSHGKPSRPPQCWNYYRVVFKLTLSHSCFQGYAEFRVEQFSLFISIKIFSSPICQSQPQQTQHNCYLLLSQLYCPHYSFIQWTMIRITLYRKLSFDEFRIRYSLKTFKFNIVDIAAWVWLLKSKIKFRYKIPDLVQSLYS